MQYFGLCYDYDGFVAMTLAVPQATLSTLTWQSAMIEQEADGGYCGNDRDFAEVPAE